MESPELLTHRNAGFDLKTHIKWLGGTDGTAGRQMAVPHIKFGLNDLDGTHQLRVRSNWADWQGVETLFGGFRVLGSLLVRPVDGVGISDGFTACSSKTACHAETLQAASASDGVQTHWWGIHSPLTNKHTKSQIPTVSCRGVDSVFNMSRLRSQQTKNKTSESPRFSKESLRRISFYKETPCFC